MVEDTGRCVNCGFLGKLRTQVDAESIVYSALRYDRETGTLNRHSGWPDNRDIPAQPTCFRNVTDLQQELTEELNKLGKQDTDSKKEQTLELIKKARDCKFWYPWTEYKSPKEHYEELNMALLEKTRKRTNKIMIFLTAALVLFALMQLYVTLALINPEHLLFDWLR